VHKSLIWLLIVAFSVSEGSCVVPCQAPPRFQAVWTGTLISAPVRKASSVPGSCNNVQKEPSLHYCSSFLSYYS